MKTMVHVKKRIITSMIAILLLIITLFGITYAYFIAKVQGNTNEKSVSVSAGKLALKYGDGNADITAEKIIPGTDIEEKTFTVTNTGTHIVESYEVIVEKVYNDLEHYEDLTYTLTCKSYKTTDYETNGDSATETGTCNGSNGMFPKRDDYLVRNAIDKGMTHAYVLTLTYNETNEDQSKDMKKTITAKVNIIDDETNYKNVLVYGNSIQDGTPSPTSPVEIESVGDKTENLFDLSIHKRLITTYNNEDITSSSLKIENDIIKNSYDYYNTGAILKSDTPYIIESGTYTLSGKARNSTINKIYVGVRYTDETRSASRINLSTNDWEDFSYTFTITETKTVDGLYLQDDSGGPTISNIEFKNIMLKKSDNLTEYEPYGKYKIPITVSGKNILPFKDGINFDLRGINYKTKNGALYLNGSSVGEVYSNNDMFVDNFSFKLKAGTYTLSEPKGSNIIAYIDNENNEHIATINGDTLVSSTFTLETDTMVNLGFYFYQKDFENFELPIILEEGSIATKYEPYQEPTTYNIILDEPMRKVGVCDTCADYIDLYNSKVYRNVKSITYKGTETFTNWIYNNNLLGFYQWLGDSYSEHVPMMTHFKQHIGNLPDKKDNSCKIKWSSLYLGTGDWTDASDLKVWITSEYLKDIPLKILYQLSETKAPETIDVEIPLINKNSVITVDTTVQPSKIETEY